MTEHQNKANSSESISIQHRLEYLGYRFIEKLVCTLPDSILPVVASVFAFLGFSLLRIRRQVALQNLRFAFPEKTSRWYKHTLFRSYRHFSMVVLEFMKMSVWKPKKIQARLESAEIDDVLETFRQGRGGILVSGHFGNWEMAMGYFHLLSISSAVIQQRQKNKLVNRRMKELREKWGMKIIYPRGAVNHCVLALKKNLLVGLLGDQDGGKRGVFVPFFGKPASTPIGAAVLHLKTGAPLFFGACIRVNGSRFRLITHRIETGVSSKVTEENIRQVTAAHASELEQLIRQYPEQYFWMHRRWKTVPVEKKR